jgi:hypothetical protein
VHLAPSNITEISRFASTLGRRLIVKVITDVEDHDHYAGAFSTASKM